MAQAQCLRSGPTHKPSSPSLPRLGLTLVLTLTPAPAPQTRTVRMCFKSLAETTERNGSLRIRSAMRLGVEHSALCMLAKQELVHLWPQTPKDYTQTGQEPMCTASTVYRAWSSRAAHMHAQMLMNGDAAEINKRSLEMPAAPGCTAVFVIMQSLNE